MSLVLVDLAHLARLLLPQRPHRPRRLLQRPRLHKSQFKNPLEIPVVNRETAQTVSAS